MNARRRLLAVLGAVFSIAAAAADPADQLKNPAQEARARALFREIRCVVCQSESIDESDADLARDVRQLVRHEIAGGATDAEVKAFLVRRYGEFILLRPPFSPGNAVLWLTPFAIVLAGAGVVLTRQRPSPTDGDELSERENARLKTLMDK